MATLNMCLFTAERHIQWENKSETWSSFWIFSNF